ncbi:MAG: pseudouridine synthase [Verrucomicrobiales bacterium]
MNSPADKGVRLNRFLASCGAGSRRGCEEFIKQGRVEINGRIVLDLGTRVQPDDHVKLDGKLLRTQSDLTLVLNKPKGYICTKSDPERRKTIYELLPPKFATLNYVGRLDYNSTGLILLTSSGEWTERLAHPRFHVEKEYEVTLERPFHGELTPQLLEGIHLSEGLAKAESVTFETRRRLRVVLTQGYNRQIRRMFSKLDYKVKSLERIRIGSLVVPSLSTGEYQILNHREIDAASTNPD